ncbi:MAG: UDP-N-acetylglucosamine 2-epimerase [Acidimicrobiales bacterium]|nr:UDP-N-acetylglucosamine 2-epimerase [Acidimicrobiales bacterium]
MVTMHRVENLHRAATVEALVELVVGLAADRPVRFVVHGPTWATLRSGGHDVALRDAGVELVDLAPHGEFVEMLRAAPLVITDGGSIQEECALLGVPTLLWRRRTERSDGVGDNVVLSNLDPGVAARFVADPDRHRRPPRSRGEVSPSDQIVDELVAELDGAGRAPRR